MAFWRREKGESHQDFEPDNDDFKGGFSVREIINGQVVNYEYLKRNRAYLLFLVFLAFVYINNHYGVEALLKEQQELNREVRELKYEAITTSAELMQLSKQSEVVRRVREAGLNLEVLTTPPRVLKAN